MKYEGEFLQFERDLDIIYITEKKRRILALLMFILRLCDFVQHSILPHPDFRLSQILILEVFMQNAAIIMKAKHMTDHEKSERFGECYTNMIMDLRDAKMEYMDMQSKYPMLTGSST